MLGLAGLTGVGHAQNAAPVVATDPIPAPTGLQAIIAASTGVELRWTAPVTTLSVTGYQVEYSLTGSAPWLVLTENTEATETTYMLPPHGLWADWVVLYRVAARNADGVGHASQPVSVYWLSPVAAEFDSPKRVVAIGRSSEVTLRWEPPEVGDLTAMIGYRIETSPDGSEWEVLVANTGTLATLYVHSGLTVGRTIHYRVRAVTAAGPGRASMSTNQSRATTRAARVPGVPVVGATARHGSILVEWVPSVDDGGTPITGYRLEQSETGLADSWSPPTAYVVGLDTSFEHTGVSAGGTRYYRVRAENAVGSSPWSEAVNATSLDDQPRAPTLTGVTWIRPNLAAQFTAPTPLSASNPIQSYILESSTTGAPGSWSTFEEFILLALMPGPGANEFSSPTFQLSPTDRRLPLPRYFRLRARSATGLGIPSNVFCRVDCEAETGTSTGVQTAPGIPVQLTAVGGRQRIVLRWIAPAMDGGSPITGYHVQRSGDDRAWTNLVAPAAATPATTFVHTSLADATTVYYRVAAINASGASGFTDSVSATTRTGAVPGAVTLASETPRWQGLTSNFSVRLSWTAASGSPLGYLLYRTPVSPAGATPVLFRSNLAAGTTTFDDTVRAGEAVDYQVRAYNLSGGGELSSGVRVDPAPTPMTGSALGDTAVGLRGFLELVSVDMSRNGGGNTIAGGKTGEFDLRVSRGTVAYPYINYNFGGERYGVGFRAGDGQWLRWVDEDDWASCVEVLFCGVRRTGDFRHFPADGRRSQWLLVWKGAKNLDGIGPSGTPEKFKLHVPPTLTGIHAYEYGFAHLNSADELVWLEHGVAAPGVLTHRAQYVRGSTSVTSFTALPLADRRVQLDWELQGDVAGWLRVQRRGGGNNSWATVCCDLAPSLRVFIDNPPSATSGADDIWTYRILVFNHDEQNVEFERQPQVNLTDGTQTVAVDGRPQFAISSQDMMVRFADAANVDHALPAATGGATPLTYAISDVSGVGLRLETVMGTPRLKGTASVGVVWATLTATDADSDVSDPLRVRIAVGDVLAAPQGLRAVGGVQHIGLAWEPPAGAVEFTGYRIEQSSDGADGSWMVLVDDSHSNGTSFVHAGLSGGQTVHYRVAAIDQSGYGTFSAPASATTDAIAAPTAPVGLVARASTGNVRLTWQAPSLNGGAPITGYQIEHQPISPGPGWTVLVDDTGLAAPMFTVHDVWPDLTVWYRVAARNSAGVGPFSDAVHAIVPLVAPPAPASLVAVPGKGEVTLRWRAPAETIGAVLLGYQIQSSADGTAGSWTDLVANTGGLGTEYVHTGLMDGQTVHYQVAAINTVGTGAFAVATSTTTLMAGAPAPPPRVEAVGLHGGIRVSWSVPGYNGGSAITDYNLQTSATGESGSWPSTISSNDNVGNVTSHDDTGVAAGIEKFYRVAALNVNGAGAWSDVVSATGRGLQPQAPVLSGMTSTLPTVLVRLTTPAWAANVEAAGEYVLESSASGAPGSWSQFATFARSDLREGSGDADATSVRLSIGAGDPRLPLAPYFRLFAVNSAGRSPPSEPFCRIDCEPPTAPMAPPTATAPGVPVGLAAVGGRQRIVLRWQPPASDGGSPVTGYRVEVSADGRAFNNLQANTASRATQYIHRGLADGVRRHYRVSALNVVNTGDATASQTARTLLAGPADPPRHLTVIRDVEMNETLLSWLAPASDGGSAITSYRIENSPSFAGPWVALAAEDTASVTSLMYTHTGAGAHGTNYYRAFANNANGQSKPSDVVRGVPATATAPRNFVVFSGNQNALVVWDPPADLGDGALIGWRLQRRDDENAVWGVRRAFTERLTSGHIDYTNTNRSKRYRVAAVTTLGVGAWSEEGIATSTNNRPRHPRDPSVSMSRMNCGTIENPNSKIAVRLTWPGAFSNPGPGIAGYRVDRQLAGIDEWETLRDGTERNSSKDYTDCALSPGDQATYRVFSYGNNTNLYSVPTTSSTVVIPGQVPVQVPTGLRVVSDITSSAVTWQAAADESVTGYRIEYAHLTDPQDFRLFHTAPSRETVSFTHTDMEDTGGVGYYRIAHLVGSEAGEFSAPAASEWVGAESVLDLNSAGGFDEDDASMLYLVFAFPELLGNRFGTSGFEGMRTALLDGLYSSTTESDVTLRDLVSSIFTIQQNHSSTALDVNQDGTLDADDALIMLYAYEIPEQLGDGAAVAGDRAIRRTLLAPLVDESNPTDERLRRLLRRANALNPK